MLKEEQDLEAEVLYRKTLQHFSVIMLLYINLEHTDSTDLKVQKEEIDNLKENYQRFNNNKLSAMINDMNQHKTNVGQKLSIK